MKVIFVKKVKNVADLGEVKEVSDGYAQNFLIARQVALPATTANIATVQASIKRHGQKAGLALGVAKKIIRKLDGIKLTIKAKANEKGTLFAGIGEKEVEQALKTKEIDVDQKHFKLDKHIKELGEHKLVVNLDHGLKARIKIVVV